jgi:hypothetical protein
LFGVVSLVNLDDVFELGFVKLIIFTKLEGSCIGSCYFDEMQFILIILISKDSSTFD